MRVRPHDHVLDACVQRAFRGDEVTQRRLGVVLAQVAVTDRDALFRTHRQCGGTPAVVALALGRSEHQVAGGERGAVVAGGPESDHSGEMQCGGTRFDTSGQLDETCLDRAAHLIGLTGLSRLDQARSLANQSVHRVQDRQQMIAREDVGRPVGRGGPVSGPVSGPYAGESYASNAVASSSALTIRAGLDQRARRSTAMMKLPEIIRAPDESKTWAPSRANFTPDSR